ncbi:MAG: hypothetical protein V4489_02870 [Chlamydiota bacterium]
MKKEITQDKTESLGRLTQIQSQGTQGSEKITSSKEKVEKKCSDDLSLLAGIYESNRSKIEEKRAEAIEKKENVQSPEEKQAHEMRSEKLKALSKECDVETMNILKRADENPELWRATSAGTSLGKDLENYKLMQREALRPEQLNMIEEEDQQIKVEKQQKIVTDKKNSRLETAKTIENICFYTGLSAVALIGLSALSRMNR